MASRVTASALEVLVSRNPSARLTTSAVEALIDPGSRSRVTAVALEVLRTRADEPPGTRIDAPKVTFYSVQEFVDSRVRVPKVTAYVTLRPSPPSAQVAKGTFYAVMEDAVNDPSMVSKATGYSVMVPSATRLLLTKATGYVLLSGQQRVSKNTGYAVMDDLTPRYIDVSKSVSYGVMGNYTIRSTKVTAYAVMNDNPKPYQQITKVTPYAVMAPLTPRVYLSLSGVEATTGGSGSARAALVTANALTTGEPSARVPLVTADALTSGEMPLARCCLVGIDVLCGPPEDPFMLDPATLLFPSQAQLPGLTFNFAKKPNFSTRIASNASGREVRNAFWDDPRWDFTLSFDYLPDLNVDTDGYTQVKRLEGFWMQRRGSFQSFLYRDSDDYLANNLQGLTDGTTLEFDLRRDFGGFLERIGQLDQAQPIELWYQTVDAGEAHTVPVTPGPYTVTATHAADYMDNVRVTLLDGTLLEEVSVAPGAMQYTVNDVTGVYTFNAAQQGASILIWYKWEITETWEVLMPNKVVFDEAPPDDRAIYGSFQFYFICRFMEDVADFQKFMDKLWELQELTFRSEIV